MVKRTGRRRRPDTTEIRAMNGGIPLGAHLVTPRKWYSHHGIYVGGGRVVHYAGLSQRLRRGPVEEVTLESFAKQFGFRIEPHAAPAFPAEEIVRRARTRIGENRYGLLSNNCEHFSRWCVTGRAGSCQVDRITRRPVEIARRVGGTLNRLAALMFGAHALAPRTA
jgi:hypothetical protein